MDGHAGGGVLPGLRPPGVGLPLEGDRRAAFPPAPGRLRASGRLQPRGPGGPGSVRIPPAARLEAAAVLLRRHRRQRPGDGGDLLRHRRGPGPGHQPPPGALAPPDHRRESRHRRRRGRPAGRRPDPTVRRAVLPQRHQRAGHRLHQGPAQPDHSGDRGAGRRHPGAQGGSPPGGRPGQAGRRLRYLQLDHRAPADPDRRPGPGGAVHHPSPATPWPRTSWAASASWSPAR